MERTFKIPKWHELYTQYFAYLENTKDATRILSEFRKKHGIECEFFIPGTDERTGKPFLIIGTYVDMNRIIHDKAKFGTDLLKPNHQGLYPVRKNSDLYKDWIATLKKEDNFRILDEPKINTYIGIDNDGKDIGLYEKEFCTDGITLLLRISSEHEYVVSDDFIEVEPYVFYDMKEKVNENKRLR